MRALSPLCRISTSKLRSSAKCRAIFQVRSLATESSNSETTGSRPTAKVTLIRPDASSPNKLWSSSLTSNSTKALDSRLLFSSDTSEINALVSLGAELETKDANAQRELVRKAAGTGVGKVKDFALSTGVREIEVDAEDAESNMVDIHATGM